jgi:hypothetical protein
VDSIHQVFFITVIEFRVMKNITQWVFILLVTVFSAVSAHAQEITKEVIVSEEFYTQDQIDEFLLDFIPTETLEEFSDVQVDVQGNTSCFDHYEFGSVQVKLDTNVSGTVSGAPMQFSGYVENNNNYPVVDGVVYVRIFKTNVGGEKNVNGSEVVDQYVAVRDINIPANGRQNISLTWDVPLWAMNGTYQLATYFVSNLKYNLLGLTFTDDIVGNTTNFTVSNGETSGVVFNKETVAINNETYRFAAFPPRIQKDEVATISAELVNTTGESADVSISYKTYYWDAMRGENKINEERDIVTVPANASVPVSYVITNTDFPVYYSEIEATHRGVKSILNPRFVREGISRPRINFPSIKTYPLVANQTAEVFTCVHATSDAVVENGRLELEVFDAGNESIHSYSYEGIITPDMMGLLDSFVPVENHETFSVQARLYQDDVLLEEDIMTYNCEQLGGCDGDKTVAKKNSVLDFYNPLYGLMALFAGVVVLILIIVIIIFKRMNK